MHPFISVTTGGETAGSHRVQVAVSTGGSPSADLAPRVYLFYSS